ncbi:MAG TPA: extracellular solute-binding protein [Thermodesulfobacteriota bacterium]|mgnify:CR=1 FL=1|nr:extracellular solute-binding protein [Deltaproteobacteria bacterium]HNR12819.1 extracellular solute-binding protein [Thermodesulfobacteriota bacterium]HQO76970.1 extracellular solute-binding protein [Thermodesulfobacteriota bacterium]
MKRIIFLAGTLIVLFTSAAAPICAEAPKALEGTITISGAWALYPMAVKWSEQFQALYPKVKIDIAAGGAGKGMADALAGAVDLGMVSRQIYPEEIKQGAWWVSVTKDAVVATVHPENPVVNTLLTNGVRRDALINTWLKETAKDWSDITGTQPGKKSMPIHVYTRSDSCGAAQTWAEYLGGTQEELQGVGVYGDPGLAEAVQKDILGIGYNNIGYVYDARTKKQVAGIRVLPLDINDNGQLDPDEQVYDDRDSIIAAISNGKYPSPPARDLHFVSQGKPKRPLVAAFLKWVLTSGQQYVLEAGYITLNQTKLQEQISRLEK